MNVELSLESTALFDAVLESVTSDFENTVQYFELAKKLHFPRREIRYKK